MNKPKLVAAIAYFEDAIRESDEIIAECSPDLQAELTEQKAHFVVALEAMRAALPDNKALTVEELRGMDGEPVWCEKKGAYVFVSTIIDEPYIQVYYFTNKGFLETVLYYHTKFYRRPPEKGE